MQYRQNYYRDTGTVMIRNKIKQFVDGLGITRFQLYKATGISRTTVYALYDDPRRIPDEETVLRIVQVYGCKTSDLVEIVEIGDVREK